MFIMSILYPKLQLRSQDKRIGVFHSPLQIVKTHSREASRKELSILKGEIDSLESSSTHGFTTQVSATESRTQNNG
jgi:hypothetical protein